MISAHPPARSAFRAIAAAIVGLAIAVSTLPPGAIPPVAAASSYRVDLYRPGDFVSQTNDVQCIGASMQMMLNMLRPADDRSAATQLELQNLARAYSPRFFGNQAVGSTRERRGASSRGWVAGLMIEGAGPYRLTSAPSLEDAVALAARAIHDTRRPVGLLVWRGAHAWVMSGFEASGDIGVAPDSRVTGVFVQDPWYPRTSRTWGRSPKPGARLTIAELGTSFVPWRRGSRVSANTNRFVLVLPYTPNLIAPGRLVPS